ncbi:MFS transporter [Candidatus Bathyarchaeota archaeon]|nr:MFS transporter [Candidatus Bathyarchaeota archaeon]
MRPIQTALLIQVFHSFASGILGIALPIMMKERQISVVTVGFVFAAMPIIFQLGRMLFATFSDFWGRKLFFISSGFLAVASGLIYHAAYAPLEYFFGKVVEGTKEGTLWAVNRAFLLEQGGGQLKALIRLRTVVYIAYAVGSFTAGYLIVWILFEGTMLLCAAFGAAVVLVAMTLERGKKEEFDLSKALRFLDFRKKEKPFRRFFILFCMMGLSLGLIGGFVLAWYLDANGFNLEMIGLILGAQVLLAGVFSHLFSRTTRTRQSILLSGVMFAITFLVLGFAGPFLVAALIVLYGAVQGIASIGQEAIASKISDKRSYGIDIGLLWTGFHITESLSLALTGIMISQWGFAAPFGLAALTYSIFAVGSYFSLSD